MYPIRIYEVDASDEFDLAKALQYLDTRTWGFVPYSEIEDSGYGIEAICFIDDDSDLDQIEDYLDSYGFHYALEEL